jgi:peptide/nickel transport system ATP-binding protein
MLSVENLHVFFRATDGKRLPAVRDVSFSLPPGEVLGLVGESGSGKSVTSLAIMRLLPPQATVEGRITFQGEQLLTAPEEKVRSLRGAQISMIFQEPMTALNPVMRVGDQVAEAVLAHEKVSKHEAGRRAIDALNNVAIADAERRSRDFPHQLSGGMRQRVMIAMAIVNRPRLLIADEPTTALDVTIQAQILELMKTIKRTFGTSILLITHNLGVIAEMADRVAVMYAGNIVEYTDAQTLFEQPKHPYTVGLLHCYPEVDGPRKPLEAIEGVVPDLINPPHGCRFHPRCQQAMPLCREREPQLQPVADGHLVSCHLYTREQGSVK